MSVNKHFPNGITEVHTHKRYFIFWIFPIESWNKYITYKSTLEVCVHEQIIHDIKMLILYSFYLLLYYNYT